MEKTISIRNTEITFSIWDLGGQREFVNMLPLVCNDAVAILFMFDLTRKSTLNSIKEWYRQGRGFNKTAIPFLVGTKYDHFVNFPREEQEEISLQAKRFAKAMKASLIFSSTSHSINVQKVSKRLRILTCSSQATHTSTDIQDRSVKGLRSALHDSGNRARRRTPSALPVRRLKNQRNRIIRASNHNKNPSRGAREHVRYDNDLTQKNHPQTKNQGLAGKRTSLAHPTSNFHQDTLGLYS